MLYFTGAEENKEPVNSLHAHPVADTTMKAVCHLFAASICNYGPAPNFLLTWIFSHIVEGIEAVFNNLPPILDTESSDYLFAVYNKICYMFGWKSV